jgi:hypothetical protein
MPRNAAERRALFYEEQSDFDPFIGVDVNEYLIENWPKLTLKQRKAVWSHCQLDEDFDWEPVWEQVDSTILLIAENDPTIDLSDVEIIEIEDEE